MFTDENCFLFINLSKNLTIDENFFFCSPRVFLFYGDIKRDKSGNTLLLGHLESIRAVIRSNLEIRYFCTLASNSLFIRKFSLDDTINQLHQKHQVPVSIERNYINDLDVCFGSIPDNGTWMWEHIANATSLHEHLQKKMDLDNLSVTQIEGLFAELSEWLLVEKYFKEIEEIAFYLKGVLWTAFEECIPVSIFRKHGKSEFTNICYMMWDGYRTASSSDVIKYNQCLPEHLCLLKWFERDIKNPATKMVTSDWGYHFLSLLNIKEILNNDELFTIETNLCNTSGKNLRKNNLCKNDFYLILKDRLINRDRIDIKDVCINSSLDSGFILLEHKNFQADIICQSLNGKFYVSATSISPQEKNQIIGYIYLECHITHPIFQISLDEKNDFLIENIVIYDGLNFTRLNPSPSKHDINLVYNFAKLCKDDSILYLGIPIFLEKSFYINIDVLY
ncbi:hypothetical protein [Acetobacter pasteurianus]|nr:hypothetical protein [Acetobacter pasteurianus]